MFIFYPMLFITSNVYSANSRVGDKIKTYGTFLVSSNLYNNEIIYEDVFPVLENP